MFEQVPVTMLANLGTTHYRLSASQTGYGLKVLIFQL